jgi:hypothetical protein
MLVTGLNLVTFHMALAALGEAWEYGESNPVGDPLDPEGLTSMDKHLFDRIVKAAKSNDVRTLQMLSMG